MVRGVGIVVVWLAVSLGGGGGVVWKGCWVERRGVVVGGNVTDRGVELAKELVRGLVLCYLGR